MSIILPEPNAPDPLKPWVREVSRLLKSIVGGNDRTATNLEAAQQQTRAVARQSSVQQDTINEQGDAIVVTSGNVDNAEESAKQARILAEGSGNAAAFAATQAAAAQQTAASAAELAGATNRSFRFTPQGAEMGRPGGRYVLSLSDTGISFQENGVAVSIWDAGQMVVKSFVGEQVVLANHKIESRGTRTIVQSM